MSWLHIHSLVLVLLGSAVARGDTFALVVGVNEVPEFRLPDGAPPRPLRGAEQDARTVAAVLAGSCRIPAANIRLLLGRDANLQAVRDELARLSQCAHRADTVLIHFSGHGTQRPDALPFDEPDGRDEGLCLSDAASDGGGLLLDDELGRLLEALPSAEVIVVLDCCHAGTGVKNDDDATPRFLPYVAAESQRATDKPEQPWRDLRPTTKSAGPSVTAFFACRPEQQAYERRVDGSADRVGQFSHYFWGGLRDGSADANGDGEIARREALDFAVRRLDQTFNAFRPEAAAKQTPIWDGDEPNRAIFPGVAR